MNNRLQKYPSWLKENQLSLVIATCLFIFALLLVETVFGYIFLEKIASALDKQKRQTIQQTWNKIIAQTWQAQSQDLKFYAWRLELALAIKNHKQSWIVSQGFGWNDQFLEKYDLFLLVGPDGKIILGHIDGFTNIHDSDQFNNNRNRSLEAAVYTIAEKKYGELLPQLQSILQSRAAESLSKPISWQYTSLIGGQIRLLSVAPICQNEGYPFSLGYVLLGNRLDLLLKDNRDLFAASIDIRRRLLDNAFFVQVIQGFEPLEDYFLHFEPDQTGKKRVGGLVSVFIAFQTLICIGLFFFFAPFFSRRNNLFLQKSISERNKKIRSLQKSIFQMQEEVNRDIAMVAAIQSHVHKPRPHRFAFADLTIFHQPAKTLVGVVCDVSMLNDNKMAIFLADAAGHGLSPALVAILIKTLLSSYLDANTSPADTMYKINRDLVTLLPPGEYLAAFYGIIDSLEHVLNYCNAGHRSPFIYDNHSKQVIRISAQGPILGLINDVQYSNQSVRLHEHDRLLVYTDTLVEQHNAKGQIFGETRIKEILQQCSAWSSEQFKEILWQNFSIFKQQQEVQDDLVVIIVDYLPNNPLNKEAGLAPYLSGQKTNSLGKKGSLRQCIAEATEQYHQKNFSLCLVSLASIVKHYPQYIPVYYSLGQIHAHLGDLTKAKKYLRTYLYHRPASQKGNKLWQKLANLKEP